ncbi:MAG: hypothetical protein ACRDBG_12970 [Waterburya sp.]
MSEDTSNVDNAPPLDPIEQEAREKGWRPKEEFDADPKNQGKRWRSAEMFVELTPLYEHTEQLKRQNKSLSSALEQTTAMFASMQAKAYDKALSDLKAQKKEAAKEGDAEKMLELDEKIEQVQTEKQLEVKQVKVQNTPPELEEWFSRNSWYESDSEMREFADELGYAYQAQKLDPIIALSKIEKRVKQAFPNKFENPARKTAASVEGSKPGKAPTGMKLTPMEEKIMDKVLAITPGLSKEDYLKELAKVKGV